MYDIIIVGGGLSGLYSAYKIKQMSPETSILLLERDRKEYIGGRTNNEMFYGVPIVIGAGIGRKIGYNHVLNLLKEKDMNIPFSFFTFKHHVTASIENPMDVMKVFRLLEKSYNASGKPRVTFKKFATRILGKKLYNDFIINSSYSDYENADAESVFLDYGMEYNVSGWTGVHIPWKMLIEKLIQNIGFANIRTSSKVEKITQGFKGFEVFIENGRSYQCKKVIVATNINSIRKLVLTKDNTIYNQIQGQPFLRLYGKFSKESIPIMQKYIQSGENQEAEYIVKGPLQKIVPMDRSKGVYMLSYSDNANAVFLKDYLENTIENRSKICALVEEALHIPSGSLKLNAIKAYYWSVGTHYYEPLRNNYHNRAEFISKAQHPMPGMLVVGEVVSLNQGWTEGALESVEAVLTKKWIIE